MLFVCCGGNPRVRHQMLTGGDAGRPIADRHLEPGPASWQNRKFSVVDGKRLRPSVLGRGAIVDHHLPG